MNLSGKKVLLLGGVQPMCQVVAEAHKIGIEVYVTDYNEDSPAKKIADKAFMVSTTDVDSIVELCKQEQIDAVFTGYTDSMLPYCKQICERLGFPFWGDDDNIANCIDKRKFKLACEAAGVQTVPWIIVTESNYMDHIDCMKLPLVIKPIDNSGSRGVFKCYRKEDYKSLCELSLSFSGQKKLMVELMMDADCEFSVYYMLYNGVAYLTEMGDRYVCSPDLSMAPLGQGMNYPSLHLWEWEEKMEQSIQKFFKQNRIHNGFIFFQGFYEKGEFYIHEAGYRLCGGFAYKYVEYFSGYNQVQQMLRYSLTGEMEVGELEKSSPKFSANALTITATMVPGIIGDIAGIEEVKKISGVLEFCQLHFVGDDIRQHGATARVFAYILCIIKDRQQLNETIDDIKDCLKVKNNAGENMLIDIIGKEKIKLFYE